MDNKYFIPFSASAAKLQSLDEPALSAQIAFWAHMTDKNLFAGKFTVGELSHQQEMLSQRLDIFSQKYDTGCAFYRWADSIRSLCTEALARPQAFVYPGQGRAETQIPESSFDLLMKGRRSVREYTNEPVEDAVILKILSYAGWAPSSCHEQALRYIVVTSEEERSKITRNGIDVKNAACIIAVLADLRMYCDSDIECACHDSGAAIQNMLLACCQLGLGACYISDTNLNGMKLKSQLHVQEFEKITALVTIGHYEKAPMAPGRIDVSKVARFI